MADLGTNNQVKDIKNSAKNLIGSSGFLDQKELAEKATDIAQTVKTKVGGAYDVASEWMEDNSITLFAIGGGILVAGLLTYFIARRKGADNSSSMDENLEKAA